MRNAKCCMAGLVLVGIVALTGCVHASRKTEGFAIKQTATLAAPFDDAWQKTKSVLRERKLEIYTRDKRGVFVAYKKTKGLALVPTRTKLTVALERSSDSSTQVTVEGVRQVYGSTLLTYPDWCDRKLTKDTAVKELLEAIQAKIAAP